MRPVAVTALAALAVLSLPAARAADPAANAAPPAKAAAAAAGSVEELARFMEGTFTSTAQATADPKNFRDIHLLMTRIWKERSDGAWFYVEQALADKLDHPYRQRVYRVTARPDGTFASEVFTLPGATIDYIGGRLDGLAPDRLVARAGCTVTLTRTDAGYAGATAGKECPSELKGASYATSEVTVRADGMTSWDRGYDAAGTQVWGAQTGPYEFRKN